MIYFYALFFCGEIWVLTVANENYKFLVFCIVSLLFGYTGCAL